VEARCSGQHAREVAALHHGQLAVHISEADGTLVPRLGESGVGGMITPLSLTPLSLSHLSAMNLVAALVSRKEMQKSCKTA
jgi:hypothetical protein